MVEQKYSTVPKPEYLTKYSVILKTTHAQPKCQASDSNGQHFCSYLSSSALHSKTLWTHEVILQDCLTTDVGLFNPNNHTTNVEP